MNPDLQKQREEVFKTRAAHIETFSAAFIKQVGSAEASKYKLVEETELIGDKWVVTWEFRKIDSTTPGVKPDV